MSVCFLFQAVVSHPGTARVQATEGGNIRTQFSADEVCLDEEEDMQ